MKIDNTGVQLAEGVAASQAALEVIGLGLLMLDCQGVLLYANAQGQRELERASVLELRDGIVMAVGVAASRAFGEAIAGARRGARSMVPLGEDAARRMFAVVPLEPGSPGYAVSRVLIVWSGESQQMEVTMQLFAKAVGLTHCERDVLQQLCEGHAAPTIAARRDVKVSTVRTQISSLRFKLGARNVPQMVAAVAALPPLALR